MNRCGKRPTQFGGRLRLGVSPVGKIVGNCDVSSPFPRYNHKSLSPAFATTQSALPSALKSAAATRTGINPPANERRCWKPGYVAPDVVDVEKSEKGEISCPCRRGTANRARFAVKAGEVFRSFCQSAIPSQKPRQLGDLAFGNRSDRNDDAKD